ncbi:MerR family transcriptional regulator [Photobacterium damselae subsp. damselae]|uniref:MerR family transcriptional regulator n=1 Tax=Photobacterium damselae TaxID=38293 RepID=UPI001EEF7169|nr:MerR family transcriptional regulator [Photobacterium damselae]UJZ96472.1 MerR family transcriptional regulator [Photobacterium damselae subsp. damselae]UJZ99623.1 MerR family transcriptional regulator [Photobacterium damselae subsp. damselae]
MFTVSQIAKRFEISRTRILYYEREGLLLPSYRSDNGYRWYGDHEVKRLEMILSYRSYGVPVSNILSLLNDNNHKSQSELLKEHFYQLEEEINKLRYQQKAVMALLKESELMESQMVTKDRWVEIMLAAGFDEEAMIKWHQKFEEMEPEEHHKFLESLGIDDDEIKIIRNL